MTQPPIILGVYFERFTWEKRHGSVDSIKDLLLFQLTEGDGKLSLSIALTIIT